MTPTWQARVAWVISALATCCATVAVAGVLTDGRGHEELLNGTTGFGSTLAITATGFGAFILTRHPAHRIGWLLVLIGASRAVAVLAAWWAQHGLVVDPGSLPGADVAAWLQWWGFLPGLAVTPLLLALYPDDRLVSPRWRLLVGVTVLVLTDFLIILPAVLWPHRGPDLMPSAPDPTEPLFKISIVVGLTLTLLALLAGLASLVLRWRRSEGDMRQCVLWFALAAALALVTDLVGDLPGLAPLRLVSPVILFAGLGLGVFRYGLYDIDRLINRTLVWGTLTVGALVAVAGVAVTAGLVLGGDSSPVAAGAAGFGVALALDPARRRLQHVVDRRFDRRTFDVEQRVASFTEALGERPPDPGGLERLLRELLEDPTLALTFPFGDDLLDSYGVAVPPAGRHVTRVQRGDASVCLVAHREPRLWEVRLAERTLASAAVALEHARLQAGLAAQREAVVQSRARLVVAADDERRRVERDLHDGAQQRLVGLALFLQTERRRAEPGVADAVLARAVDELQAAISELRSLARGLLPPVLTTSGLVAALDELAGRALSPMDLHVVLPRRAVPGSEAAAWYVVCEGVANVAKHAAGSRAQVWLDEVDDRLRVRVSDDGPGGADPAGSGLRGLADRVEACRGRFTVTSRRGRGTTLEALLPCV